ncbi:MAG: hypothetical protein MK108_11900 [Mariniblastus sp.]|nr:hypothetical protein [Mariniblastus sp.]
MAMIRGRSRTDTSGNQNDSIINQMQRIASRYTPRQNGLVTGLQDFHSLRQALNCASADQRPLVVISTKTTDRADVEKKLKSLFNEDEIIGKFHLDFIDRRTDRGWQAVIEGADRDSGILIVRSSQFGLNGKVLQQVPLDADTAKIKQALLKANRDFAQVEVRKNYEQHVQAGRRQRIQFENEVSNDGAIDNRQNRQRRGRR